MMQDDMRWSGVGLFSSIAGVSHKRVLRLHSSSGGRLNEYLAMASPLALWRTVASHRWIRRIIVMNLSSHYRRLKVQSTGSS